MVDSVVFQNHCRDRVIFRTERQGIESRSPVPYNIEKNDKTDIVQIITERTPHIANFQQKTPLIPFRYLYSTLLIPFQCLYNTFPILFQYLFNIYSIFIQYLFNTYSMLFQYFPIPSQYLPNTFLFFGKCDFIL